MKKAELNLKKLCKVKRNLPLTPTDVFEEPLHFNASIKRARKVIHEKEWESLGILKIKHVLNEDGRPLSYNDFKIKYTEVNTNVRIYLGISNAINKYLDNIRNGHHVVKNVLISEVWACIGAGNKFVKEMFQQVKILPTASVK